MNTRLLVVRTTLVCAFWLGAMAHAAGTEGDDERAPADVANKAGGGAWVSAGAGCLGGAALGMVLPGLGNLIGCVIGGVSAIGIRAATAADADDTAAP